MYKKNNGAFLVLALLISACAATKSTINSTDRSLSKSVEIALENLPARSALEAEVLNERLLAFGEQSIVHICMLLQENDSLRTQAEFALHGLAIYVTQPDKQAQRQQYNRGLARALQTDLSPENKAFLLEQLALAGSDDAIPAIKPFLRDSFLADAAIRALLAIGTGEAEKTLVEAYDGAENAIKVKLLFAFAHAKNGQAVAVLQREATSKNKAIAEAAQASLKSRSVPRVTASSSLEANPLSTRELSVRLLAPGLDTRLHAIDGLMFSSDSTAAKLLIAHLLRADGEKEIAATEKALQYLPLAAHFPALHAALSTANAHARAAILRLLALRRARQFSGEFLRRAQADPDSEVRQAALQGVEILGSAEMLSTLADRLLETDAPAEQAAIRQTFTTIAHRERANEKAVVIVRERLQKADATPKTSLVQLLGKMAGATALNEIIALTGSDDTGVREAAKNALFEWPDASAATHLLNLAESTEVLRDHVLALRACARFIANDSVANHQKLSIFDRGMALARRVDEQKMLLGSLQNVHSPLALNRALAFVENPELTFEAAVTVAELSGRDRRSRQPISRQEIITALLHDRLSPQDRAKLQDYFDAQREHNLPPQGFQALFNGIDLTGWKGLVKNPLERVKMAPEELAREQAIADSIMRTHWFVENGVLRFDGTQFYNLCTNKKYDDFELMLDWKIAEGGDSGIYLRGTPQVQIWDPELPNAHVGSGGLYNNQNNPSLPLVRADKPVGEWNSFRILMAGDKVTVYLNEVLVVDEVVLENYWQRDRPIFSSGQIELQAHNSPLWFRNIFIREIPRPAPAFDGALFNGEKLSGWQIIDGQEGSWEVKDSTLITTGKGGGWLSTDREFDNFELELEFRVSEGGNSGVFLRAPHNGDPAYTGMEIQVLDDYAEKYATLKPWQYTGSIYAVQSPTERATKRFGEWQKMVIVCDGPKVDVTLNGTKIIDTNMIDHMEKAGRNPGLKRRSGFIGLQNHGSIVAYRNIRLTELR